MHLARLVVTRFDESVSANPGRVFVQPNKPGHTRYCGLIKYSLVADL